MSTLVAATPQSFFRTLPQAGRRITAGFTYLQRIGKAAQYDVWFPQAVGKRNFQSDWAAVRQFELLQEAGNHKIYDLDPQNVQRATLDLSRGMRAGGLRVTVATLGRYEDRAEDDLSILDQSLRDRIAGMIHMLYLDEASASASDEAAAQLAAGRWDYRQALPHVGMVLGTEGLFRQEAGGGMRLRRARRFFEILAHLPQTHIAHDTAIGLQLPELSGENHWNYVAHPEDTLDSFNRVLNALFDPFNRISMARLNGFAETKAEIKSSTFHLRGYGHPLRAAELAFYRQAALSLPAPG